MSIPDPTLVYRLEEGADGDPDMREHEPRVLRYLHRLCAPERAEHACRATEPAGFLEWRDGARPVLRRLVGLDRIAQESSGYVPHVALGAAEDLGEYTRRAGVLHSEPDVQVPFWLLEPKTPGPHPLAAFPHGHEDFGKDTYAGICRDEAKRRRVLAEDRDVAVQAVRRGFVAVAPTTRGFAPSNVPDVNARHDKRNCRCQMIHCLLAGRTAIGERVWDLERLIDWATTREGVDGTRILMMGNSGGGVATLYASACDTRVSVSVPSCSFCTYVGANGLVHHCDCNTVPGILRFGEFYDVAGLIAPRHLLTVNGSTDTLFPLSEVDRAFEGTRGIYQAAGVPDHYRGVYGDGGHRFYSHLMWPFVDAAMG